MSFFTSSAYNCPAVSGSLYFPRYTSGKGACVCMHMHRRALHQSQYIHAVLNLIWLPTYVYVHTNRHNQCISVTSSPKVYAPRTTSCLPSTCSYWCPSETGQDQNTLYSRVQRDRQAARQLAETSHLCTGTGAAYWSTAITSVPPVTSLAIRNATSLASELYQIKIWYIAPCMHAPPLQY